MSFITLDVVAFCDRVSDGLVFVAKSASKSYRTKPQLDQAVAALSKMRDILDECDKAILKALEENPQVLPEAYGELQSSLVRMEFERNLLRQRLDVLLGKESFGFKTASQARKIRFKAESLQSRTFNISESIKDMIVSDEQFLKSLSQSMKRGESSQPSGELPEKNSKHAMSTMQEEQEDQLAEDKTIPKAAREVPLASPLLGLGILNIPTSSINQITIHSTITVHMGEVHNKQGN